MRETQTGEGRWRITYDNGDPVMTEIWLEPHVRVVIGTQVHEAGCAVCGRQIATMTPDNAEFDMCTGCSAAIADGRL